MSNLSRLMALLLTLVFMPGAVEIAENAVHLVSEGHGAHAFNDADHQPKGDEHGCSGAVHVCACHGSASFLLTHAEVAVPSPLAASSMRFGGRDGRLTPGHRLGVERPPAA